ncbi:hypothetical protein A2755_02450 [Candidatus Wolfebacteria bacterium RIFCSPHIGHO2_01_FULL_48_22]|uniref:Uncharacterized protein n=2 Tax=Candidatus Wolfeibacteriota TaxID=1752735 RepID=A0A1F8DRI3_9BACT|nr:MAG: hypothetical protein A2755_02450 [Candidatus Wolfebacteria bacterium RIFCSPHIGHO2_01_FULL_48_22]OGM92261.1 MAG: hypothetical protein A2935_00620 [Candidatus Wolfebacteria bacterium RIFCSPLOWO2_01_FULL_47_17b]
MKDRHFLQSQLLQTAIIFLIIVALSYTVFPLLPVSVNYALAAAVVGAFFLSEITAYALYTLLLLVWLKYAPSVTAELFFTAAASVAAFAVVRFLVLKKSFFMGLLMLACFHILFWLIFFEGTFFTSVYFYLEFLYTGALAILLYGLHIWAQKISH